MMIGESLPRLNDAAIVCVIDDDEDVCKALERLLRSTGLAVETFPSPQAFLSYPLADQPSCLVLDVQLPGQSGLDLQTALEQADLNIPIVFVTGHGDVPTSVRAMKAGALDFLTKPVRHEDLMAAIAQVEEREEKERDSRQEVDAIRRRVASLTPREREVLTHVIAGRLNKQIAGDLGTVEKTIKVHRGRVMAKMGVRTVAQLVRMAGKIGI